MQQEQLNVQKNVQKCMAMACSTTEVSQRAIIEWDTFFSVKRKGLFGFLVAHTHFQLILLYAQ